MKAYTSDMTGADSFSSGVTEWSIIALTSREPVARTIISIATLLFGAAGASIAVSGQLPGPAAVVAALVSASTVGIAWAWHVCTQWPTTSTSIAFLAYGDVAVTAVLMSMKSAALALPLCGGLAILAIFALVATSTTMFKAHTVFSGLVIAVLGARAIDGVENIWIVVSWMIAAAGTFTGPFVLKAYIYHLRQWAHRALHDPLTGLLNARGLSEAADQANNANRTRGRTGTTRSIGATIIDIDRFRTVNKRFGYEQGDFTLIAVALRLVHAASPDTIVARLSSDQFASIHLGTTESVSKAQRRIVAAMDEPFTDPLFTTSTGTADSVTIPAADQPSAIIPRLLADANIELLRHKANADSSKTPPPHSPEPPDGD